MSIPNEKLQQVSNIRDHALGLTALTRCVAAARNRTKVCLRTAATRNCQVANRVQEPRESYVAIVSCRTEQPP